MSLFASCLNLSTARSESRTALVDVIAKPLETDVPFASQVSAKRSDAKYAGHFAFCGAAMAFAVIGDANVGE